MAINPKELGPQYDFSASQAVQAIEEKLAEAEHITAKQSAVIRRLEDDLRHWKQLHTTDQERIIKLQRELRKGSDGS